jgi:hypothetical protein
MVCASSGKGKCRKSASRFCEKDLLKPLCLERAGGVHPSMIWLERQIPGGRQAYSARRFQAPIDRLVQTLSIFAPNELRVKAGPQTGVDGRPNGK